MPDLPDLPPTLAHALDQRLRQVGEAKRSGDLTQAFTLARQAWDALPEPRTGWNFYPQIIARSLLDKAVALHDRAEVETWLAATYDAYDDPGRNDHFVNMLEGEAWRALGDDDSAYAAFDRIFTRDGRAGFRGEHRAHLEWYLEARAARG